MKLNFNWIWIVALAASLSSIAPESSFAYEDDNASTAYDTMRSKDAELVHAIYDDLMTAPRLSNVWKDIRVESKFGKLSVQGLVNDKKQELLVVSIVKKHASNFVNLLDNMEDRKASF